MAKDGSDQGAWVIERRRHARTPGPWAVRWIVGECEYMVVLETRALDASIHGLRLEVPLQEFSRLLVPGQRHRIELGEHRHRREFQVLGRAVLQEQKAGHDSQDAEKAR